MPRLLRPLLIVLAVAISSILLSTTSIAQSAGEFISGDRIEDGTLPASKLTFDAERALSGVDVQTRSLKITLKPGQRGGASVGCGSSAAIGGGLGEANGRILLETSGPGLVREGVPYQWSMQYRNPSKTTVKATLYALCAKSARAFPSSAR